ncbi:energy-coupling factor transporter transmembrane protein EcfT, partial [Streptococcus agalactiae]
MFRRLKLDPRTSIILLLLVNIFFFKSRTVASELVLIDFLRN